MLSFKVFGLSRPPCLDDVALGFLGKIAELWGFGPKKIATDAGALTIHLTETQIDKRGGNMKGSVLTDRHYPLPQFPYLGRYYIAQK